MAKTLAPWKQRALQECDRDIDQAFAALVADLRKHDEAAAVAAQEELSHVFFHRRFSSPAEMRDFIVSFLEPGQPGRGG